MLRFAGNHALALDDKDRVVLPLALRKCIDETEREGLLNGGFMVRPSDTNEYLELFPKEEYDKYIEVIEGRYSPEDFAGQAYLRFFTARVEPVDLDRQYRFTVPAMSKAAVGLTKDVVFVGRTKKIEIWDKSRWEDWQRKHAEHLIPPASAGPKGVAAV